jgi:hypothetical protein
MGGQYNLSMWALQFIRAGSSIAINGPDKSSWFNDGHHFPLTPSPNLIPDPYIHFWSIALYLYRGYYSFALVNFR